MTKKMSVKLEMFQVLGIYLDGCSEKLEKVPAYHKARAQFDEKVAKIKAATSAAATKDNGKTATQAAASRVLYQLADAVRDMLYAYAVRAGNHELADVAKKFKKETIKLRGSERLARITAFAERAAEFKDHLAEYAEQDTLQKLQQAIEALTEARAKKRGAALTRKLTKKDVESLFRSTSKLVRVEFCAVMAPFKQSDPAVYQGFLIAKTVSATVPRREKVKNGEDGSGTVAVKPEAHGTLQATPQAAKSVPVAPNENAPVTPPPNNEAVPDGQSVRFIPQAASPANGTVLSV